MELFCALLTGFFLWLFFFHSRRSTLGRARDAAGALLIEVKPTRRAVQAARSWLIWSAGLMFLALFFIICLQFWHTHDARGLSQDFLVGICLFNFFQAVFPSYRSDAPLELRQRGVVRPARARDGQPRPPVLTPWSEISGCRWYDELPKRDTLTRLLFLERGDLPLGEVEAVTAVAARFVPVYDVEGTLIAEPTPTERAAGALLPKPSGAWKFQFSLQSLMLLMVVVSCAASCYGIHYRRAQPQRTAVARFERFHPIVYERADDVWLVDFKASAVKPGDDDLVHLERLPVLEHLYLDGSPITDAGLKHLYTLKALKWVSLGNTQVTQRGLDDLQKALPNATISCYPPPAAVVKPSAKGQ